MKDEAAAAGTRGCLWYIGGMIAPAVGGGRRAAPLLCHSAPLLQRHPDQIDGILADIARFVAFD